MPPPSGMVTVSDTVGYGQSVLPQPLPKISQSRMSQRPSATAGKNHMSVDLIIFKAEACMPLSRAKILRGWMVYTWIPPFNLACVLLPGLGKPYRVRSLSGMPAVNR